MQCLADPRKRLKNQPGPDTSRTTNTIGDLARELFVALSYPLVRSDAELDVQPREKFREIVRHKIRDIWRVRQ